MTTYPPGLKPMPILKCPDCGWLDQLAWWYSGTLEDLVPLGCIPCGCKTQRPLREWVDAGRGLTRADLELDRARQKVREAEMRVAAARGETQP